MKKVFFKMTLSRIETQEADQWPIDYQCLIFEFYTAFWLQIAKADGKLIGLDNCSIGNISDSVMEGAHKPWKQGKYTFSGGRSGPTGRHDYQKQVITRQFINEWVRAETNEMRPSSITRRQLEFDQDDEQVINFSTQF